MGHTQSLHHRQKNSSPQTQNNTLEHIKKALTRKTVRQPSRLQHLTLPIFQTTRKQQQTTPRLRTTPTTTLATTKQMHGQHVQNDRTQIHTPRKRRLGKQRCHALIIVYQRQHQQKHRFRQDQPTHKTQKNQQQLSQL